MGSKSPQLHPEGITFQPSPCSRLSRRCCAAAAGQDQQTRPAMVSAETSGAIAYGVSNVWAGRA
jgi:hypothetical protein